MRLCQGRAEGGQGKSLPQRVVGMEQLPRAVGTAPCRCSGSAGTLLSYTGLGFWAVLCGLDTVILMGLFQLGVFCDSVIL